MLCFAATTQFLVVVVLDGYGDDKDDCVASGGGCGDVNYLDLAIFFFYFLPHLLFLSFLASDS